jgi:hypothetical protein
MAETTAPAEHDAPEGQVWVCEACGKHSKNRTAIGDVSCFLNAVLCYDTRQDGVWEVVIDV